VFGGSFIGLMLRPANFTYLAFALLIAANGIGSGMFASPNSSSIMGSVPARQRSAPGPDGLALVPERGRPLLRVGGKVNRLPESFGLIKDIGSGQVSGPLGG
jgi:hypothetical protein